MGQHPGPQVLQLPEEARLVGLERVDLAIVEDELDGGDERALAQPGQEQEERTPGNEGGVGTEVVLEEAQQLGHGQAPA